MVDETEIVTGFYEAAFDAARFRHALRLLGELATGVGATLLLWDRQAAEPALLASAGHMGEDAPELYRRRFARIDPYRPVLAAMAPNEWTQCADHFDDGFVARSPWFNEFLIPRGVHHIASTRIATDAQFDAFLNVHRGRAGEPFSVRDLRRFGRVGLHVGRAVQAYLDVTRANLGRAAAAALPSHLAIPALLVGANARVLFANLAAEALLDADGPLGIRSGRLEAVRDSDGHQLSRIIGVAATTGVGGEMVVHRQPGQVSIRVLVAPAGSVATLYRVSPVPSALVLLQDGADDPTSSAGGLRRRFNLTNAEARLAEALLDGKRLADVAASRNVSVETVRTQLRSLFKKTGTKRQADLVRTFLARPEPSLGTS